MRVSGGYLGGRTFVSPKGHRTHPMAERVRNGLFNVLGDINNLKVLDAYAGSGALSIEAISRGAKAATAIDVDKRAYEAIVSSVKSLDISEKVKAVKAGFGSWSNNNLQRTYDLVFADPPYDKGYDQSIELLVKHVAKTGILVLSWPGKEVTPKFNGLHEIANKKYGDSQLVFYKKIS